MCLSAEVDLMAGLVIGVVAIDGLAHVRRHDQLLLAGIPVTLAVHQLVEAIVWWNLEGRVPDVGGRAALWVYLLIALVLIPVLVPAAVAATEPATTRLHLSLLTVVGAAVALVFLYSLLGSSLIGARIEGRHIVYHVELWWGSLLAVFYVLATCGSLLVSTHAHIRRFGGLNLVAAASLGWLNEDGFISLWCLWAAVTSVAIAYELRCNTRTAAQTGSMSAPGPVGAPPS